MKTKIATIGALFIVVFIAGIILGNTYSPKDDTTTALQQSELNAESFLIEQELFDTFETTCDVAEKRLTSLSQQLWTLGKSLSGENSKEQLGEETYRYLKLKYHLMQIRTYVLEKNLHDDCHKPLNVILYYYAQNEQSRQQGQILDELATTRNIHIFAIEHQYSKELAFMEDYYSVATAPTLIINFNTTLTGLNAQEAIVPHLYD